jgi:hypothetical protein
MWAVQNTAPNCTLSISGVWLYARSRLGLNLDLYGAVYETLLVGQRIDVKAMIKLNTSGLPPKEETDEERAGKPTATSLDIPMGVPPSWFAQFVAVNKGPQPDIILVEDSTEKRTWAHVIESAPIEGDFTALYGAEPNMRKDINLSSTRWFWNRTTAQTPSYKIWYNKTCG